MQAARGATQRSKRPADADRPATELTGQGGPIRSDRGPNPDNSLTGQLSRPPTEPGRSGVRAMTGQRGAEQPDHRFLGMAKGREKISSIQPGRRFPRVTIRSGG